MPFFGGKKVKPEDEEKSEPAVSPESDVANPDSAKEPRKLSGKDAPKNEGKKDQAVDATDQAFASSVGVDTSGNLSETKANTPVKNARSNAGLEPSGPDPGEIFCDNDRPVWDTRFDFLISMIGFAVDISNVWRFPWLCFKHRGIIFLVPYFIVLVLCVFPIFYLELILGQFVRKGIIGIWRICPLFKGVGYATLLITHSVVYTYNNVLTWTLHFAVESWSHPIPWTTCNNDWNTKDCIEMNEDVEQTQRKGRLSGYEYFHGETLQRYDSHSNTTYSMVNIGQPVTKNYIYLTIVYLLLIIFLIRGMKNTVKVMWYSTGITFVILTILVFRGITLPGSFKGLKYLVSASSFSKLADAEMWVDAASQVLYSTGLGFGVHLTFSSFNPFHHFLLRDCIIVMSVNVFASFVSVIAVFGFIGGHAFFLRTEISEKNFQDVDTIFDIFPDVLARLPANKFFVFSFFVMIFMLSFSSVLAAFQVVILGIKDELKNDKKTTAGCKTCVLTAVAVAITYGLGLVSLTQGGYDIFSTIDDNSATSSLLLCTFLHLIGVSWFYGLDNVCRAVHAMYGRVPNICLRICWKFVSPIILLALIVGDILYSSRFTEPGHPRVLKLALGAVLTWFPILLALVVLCAVVIRMKGPAKCICLISPDLEHDEIRKVGNGSRSFKKHWTFVGSKDEIAEIKGVKKPKAEVEPDKRASKEGKEPEDGDSKDVQLYKDGQENSKGKSRKGQNRPPNSVVSSKTMRSGKKKGSGATRSTHRALSQGSSVESLSSPSRANPPKA